MRFHVCLHTLLLSFLVFFFEVSAHSKSVDIFAVDYPIVAYIVDVKNAETTYAIACASDTHTSSCDFVQPYTLIQGRTTVEFTFTAPSGTASQALTLGCKLAGTTSMGCTATGLSPDSPTITQTETFTYTGAKATPFFSPIPLVSHSSSLMTYTPGVAAGSIVHQALDVTSAPPTSTPTPTPTPTPLPTGTSTTGTSTSINPTIIGATTTTTSASANTDKAGTVVLKQGSVASASVSASPSKSGAERKGFRIGVLGGLVLGVWVGLV